LLLTVIEKEAACEAATLISEPKMEIRANAQFTRREQSGGRGVDFWSKHYAYFLYLRSYQPISVADCG
jgi:hypothetical protein